MKRSDNSYVQRLREASEGDTKRSLAASWIADMGGRWNAEAVEAIEAELTASAELLDWAGTLAPDVNTAYLRARVCDALAHPEACAAWESFFALQAQRDPFHVLAYARQLAAAERWNEAAAQLQLALSNPVPYAFFTRAEKIITEVAPKASHYARQSRIAVLGSSTLNFFISVLKALCLRDRIKAEVYQGLYGATEQEIFGQGGLSEFQPNVVLLLNNWRDLGLQPIAGDEEAVIEAVVAKQKALWRTLAERFSCHVIQQAFDLPAEEAYGYLASALPGGRQRLIERINERFYREAPANVSILDTPSVQRRVGLERWENPMMWHSFRQHPATEALPELVELAQAHIRSVLGLTRKVLVTDLDNTLWKGVIGEDGVDGIRIGPGAPEGEAHLRLQQYMLDLKSRGILLAVSSKNNPDDARLPFQQHEHMALHLDDFAALFANWDDKATNIRRIAEKLSLGLDSFVFLDDNPLERAWVRSQLPQVAVVELGPSVHNWVRELDRGRHFYALSLSKEDLARAEQYRTESQREELRESAQSFEEFLAQLQLTASASPITEKNLQRVTQLVNKTNQFNVTTPRYTEEQVRQLAGRPDTWCAAFQLADRMGSYGLIGLLFCVPDAEPRTWVVDTWLMSCRVLGRQMEQFMFDRMVEAASREGIREIRGLYRATKKNVLVVDLFDKLGFDKIEESEGEKRYRLTVPAAPVTTATHIRDITIGPAVSLQQA